MCRERGRRRRRRIDRQADEHVHTTSTHTKSSKWLIKVRCAEREREIVMEQRLSGRGKLGPSSSAHQPMAAAKGRRLAKKGDSRFWLLGAAVEVPERGSCSKEDIRIW